MLARDHSKKARTFIVVGMFILTLGIVSLRSTNAWLNENTADFVRGLLMGIGIACNGVGVWLLQRRSNRSCR